MNKYSGTVRQLGEAVDRFLADHAEERFFAIDYRDDGVYFGRSGANQLLFHDGRSSDWSTTAMLRIFNSGNELYAFRLSSDHYLTRIIEREEDDLLPERLDVMDRERLYTLPEGVYVLDERHELWGTTAKSVSPGSDWVRYSEERGNAVFLPVKLNRDHVPVYCKVRNYIEAREGRVHVVDARLCGVYYLENGDEKEVL